MRTCILAVSALAMLIGACAMTGPGCPCGQSYDRDPFDPTSSMYVPADHEESAHCFCRCGDGPRERLAPSEACEAYEGPCQTGGGAVSTYTCE